jgi:hypothetical protein
MKINAKILTLSLAAIVAIVLLAGIAYRYWPVSMDPKSVCLENGLEWLDEYNECEFMSEETCLSLDGTWAECGSSCRHKPNTTMCILMCVPYCSFN